MRKRKVNQLNDEQMKKKKRKKLMKIICDNMENIITSDESLFFVPNQKCKRDVCYERKGEKRKIVFEREERFAKEKVMVWGGITFNGKTELIIIDSDERFRHSIIHIPITYSTELARKKEKEIKIKIEIIINILLPGTVEFEQLSKYSQLKERIEHIPLSNHFLQ